MLFRRETSSAYLQEILILINFKLIFAYVVFNNYNNNNNNNNKLLYQTVYFIKSV